MNKIDDGDIIKNDTVRTVHFVICAILLISTMSGSATEDNNTTTYVSYIDDRIGFFKVINTAGTKEPLYKDRVLTINQGDTVMWLNDAEGVTLTVVSEQDLWDKKKSKLGSTSRRFSYTFMISGTYSVYIEGYENIAPQKIIVNPVEGYPIPAPSIIPTPTTIQTQTPSVTPTPTPVHTVEISSIKTLSKDTDLLMMSIANKSLVNSSNNTSEKIMDNDLSWDVIIGLINAISNLIISLSIFLVAYKIWKDFSFNVK